MPDGPRDGPRFWRSLEERAGTEEFQRLLRREFPEEPWSGAPELDRRRFLQLMAASLALGGLAGCTRQPEEKIVPWVRPPEEAIPGRPLWFATAATHEGAATGLLVESHLGRPTKIEGNPDHPASLGAASAFDQAAVLGLYDPDRSRAPTRLGEIRTWPDLRHELEGARESQARTGGAGLRVLTGSVLSPTLADQLATLLDRFPKAKWHQWEPCGRANAREGARLAFGRPAETRYDLAAADVVLTIDGDLLSRGPGSLRYAREFARRRRVEEDAAGWNRLYAVESVPTDTGTLADHRFPLRPREVTTFALGLAAGLGVLDASAGAAPFAPWLDPLIRDLRAHAGRSVIHAGDQLPPALHALVHAMNDRLGNLSVTVIHTEPIVARPVDPLASLRELVADLESGAVEVLLILGANPVFTAPPDLKLAEALRRAPLRVHLGLHADETAEHCHWHVPEAHFLESWSDARAFDGTATVVQPLIEPLFGARTAHELVALLLGESEPSAYETVRAFWRKRSGEGADFEALWRRSLQSGVIPGTAFPALPLRADPGAVARAAGEQMSSKAPEAGALELVLLPDPTIGDGRFANNAWLQELPKPLTKLVWDNAALVAPATAARLGLRNEDVVELARAGARVSAPVWIVPGLAEETVAVHFGPGRRRAGRVGNGSGFDAYPLRTSDAFAGAASVALRKTGARFPLACTQGHFQMEGRDLVRVLPLEEARHAAPAEPAHAHVSLFPPREAPGPAWGMSIDLGACTGCSACVVACQAENNIPTVGKAEVLRHREMHWLRIDRWYEGDPARPRILHQPVPCMHCEQAPCEPVCPVGATTHSPDGLNEMTYNRCVGTRYCSNNCPYKVRRFNFFPFAASDEPLARLLQNPDVTVRGRGVMEKCTYCVQRIRQAGIDAEREGRALGDGDVVTACQQSCPTEAIVFGDLKLLESRVARRRASGRSYALLADLGTRPRTTYLARAVHPNPELGA